MRTRTRRFASFFPAAAAALALAAAAPPADLHLKLEKAEPAIGATVQAPPTEIRLVFSEKPNPKLTSIRLLDASRTEIPLCEVLPDARDPKIVATLIEKTLEPGTYTVTWRTMSADSHVVTGEFEFVVRGAQ